VPPLFGSAASARLAAPFAAEPPALPPPAQRLSYVIPPSLYAGGQRETKPVAPIVSEPPAQANPNLLNLLLEVPYKRGVHTVSVNQRYLNHEPAFDAAFELLPAAAAFGLLRAGGLYRFRLALTNVSNLPQRFVIKQGGQQARVIYTPGVAAPGLTVPIEVELSASDANAGELAETLTIVTEREEILLPVSATILTAEEHEMHGAPPPAAGARLLATGTRDPLLARTVPVTVRDVGAGTKRFIAPPRDPDAPAKLRPDFDDDETDEEDEAALS